jgi:outer membrane receptor for ferrienterochelin and colicins
MVLPSEPWRRRVVCGLLYAAVTTSLHAGQTPRAPPPRDLAELSIEDLMSVEITTASKSREKQSDAPAIVEVLTRDELHRFGGTTLKDVLTRVPGLAAVSGYFTDRSMIGFPGDALQAPTSRHVLLLINGRPVREVQEGGIKTPMLEAFPIDAIERIEVVKGPGSVLYGSEAFAGVINIITIKPDRNGLAVGGLGGSSAYGATATATIKEDDFSMLIAGNDLKRADWRTPYTFQSGTDVFSVSHDIPNRAAATYIDARYKNLTVMASIDQNTSSYFIPPFQVAGDARWRQLFADAGYVLNVRDTWTMNVNVTFNQSLFDVTDGTFPNIARNSRELLGEWTSFYKPSEKSRVIVGGTVADTRGVERIIDPPIVVSEGTRSSYGGYAQADYQVAKTVNVIGGFQANKIGQSPVTVVPRAGLIWRPAGNVIVKALYGEAFRAPYINELHIDHPGLLGNPNLKAEHVSSIDVEVSYIDAHVELVAKYFDNRQRDNIVEVLTAAETRPHYENAGLANINGVELSGKRYVSASMYLTGSLLYQGSDDGSGIQNITHVANFGAKAGFSYRTESGTISLFDVYQGDVVDRLHQTLNTQPGSYHLLALHGIVNMNKALGLTRKQEVALIFQGDNLLNEQLWVPALGSPATDTVPYNKGRAAYLKLKVGF